MVESSMNTINFTTVRVKGLLDMLSWSIQADVPLMILGNFGLGKSTICKQYSDNNGFSFLDGIRIGSLSPEDAGGYAVPDYEKEIVKRFAPDLITRVCALRKKTNKPVLVLLDEFTSGNQPMQGAMYSFVCERHLQGFELPKDTRIVLAGNLVTSHGIVYDLSRPLLDRVALIEFLGPTFDEWEFYALANDVHPLIIGHLKQNAGQLIDINPDAFKSPTPRSWVLASELLWAFEEDQKNNLKVLKDSERRITIIASTVGSTAALLLEASIRAYDKITPFSEIMRNPKKAYVDSAFDCQYMTLANMSIQVCTPEEFGRCLIYLDRTRKELCSVFFRAILADSQRKKWISDQRFMKIITTKFSEFTKIPHHLQKGLKNN